jgi:probable HAF family extracellular repeat protein
MKTAFVLTCLIALAAVLVAQGPRRADKPSHQSDRFTALGDLAGGFFDSVPYGVSADGLVVVGYSNSATGMEAFRWTRRDGMAGLGFPKAFAVNADGSTVVGYRLFVRRAEPVRWTERGSLQGLGNIGGYEYAEALGASADGSVIVGRCESDFLGGKIAFQWTPSGGIARLGSLPIAAVGAEAHAVSLDGEVVVGAVQYESNRSAAFRWTSKNGLVELGALPGDSKSIAYAVSADGSVVVGLSESGLGAQAFRWTEKTGMVGLGALLRGDRDSRAFGVSADGSIIVGQGQGESGLEAFVWDAKHGMRSVRQLLLSATDSNASLRGWKLLSAAAVSRDGSVIVGLGKNPSGDREAWIARLGDKPSTDEPRSSGPIVNVNVGTQKHN